MNFKEEFATTVSKARVLQVVEYIGKEKQHFKNLVHLLNDNDHRIRQNTAWVLTHFAEKQPKLIEPHLELLLKNLSLNSHDALIRNTVRVFKHLNFIPENVLGHLVDLRFRYLATPSVPVAIKVYSMQFLAKVAKSEPDILPEFLLLIEEGV